MGDVPNDNFQSTLALAMEYAAKGIPVLPLGTPDPSDPAHSSKEPAAGGRGFLDASVDPATIKAQWEIARTRGIKNIGVGIVPGRAGYVVIDIDTKNPQKDGLASWNALELGKIEDQPCVARTASGAWHVWVRKADVAQKIGNGHSLGPGLDVRADGGYIVAPGTSFPELGTWEWLKGNLDTVPDIPYTLSELLIQSSNSSIGLMYRPERMDAASRRAVDILLSWGGHNLYQHKHNLDGGEVRWTANICRPGKMGGISISVGYKAEGVCHTFSDGWSFGDKGSLPDNINFDVDVLEAIDKDVVNGKYNLDEVIKIVDKKRAEINKGYQARGHTTWLSWSQVMEMPPPEYLVDGLLVKDSLAMLFGDTNVGKSFVALDIAAHVALGWDWNGHKVEGPGKVLYIACEGERGFVKRMLAWSQHHKTVPASGFMLYPKTINLTTDLGIELLIKAVEQYDADLIIIDTLARSVAGQDESSNADMAMLIEAIDSVRHASNACILLVHHTGHGDKGRARGASALKAAVETEISVAKTKDGLIELKGTKSKDGEVLPPELYNLTIVPIDDTDMTSCVIVKANNSSLYSPDLFNDGPGEGQMLDNELAILNSIYNHGGSATKSEIEEDLVGPGKTYGAWSGVANAAKRLQERGLIERPRGVMLLTNAGKAIMEARNAG